MQWLTIQQMGIYHLCLFVSPLLSYTGILGRGGSETESEPETVGCVVTSWLTRWGCASCSIVVVVVVVQGARRSH
jgi:hypothetical protein